MNPIKLKKTWIRDCDCHANLGHYEWTLETANGWIHLTPEQNAALEKLEAGAYGNPLLNGDEAQAK